MTGCTSTCSRNDAISLLFRLSVAYFLLLSRFKFVIYGLKVNISEHLIIVLRLTQVTHHLRQLFDNINGLEFQVEQDGEVSKHVAVGMYSKEKEYAEFDKPTKLIGQVGDFRTGHREE